MGGQHDTQQRTHGTTAVRETKDGRETVKGTAGGEEEESGGERGRRRARAERREGGDGLRGRSGVHGMRNLGWERMSFPALQGI